MKLREAMNTYNVALFLIKEKGFQLKLVVDSETDEISSWEAYKDQDEISASDPLTLLALVTVYEQYGENWNQVETGDVYDDLLESIC